MQNFLGMIFEIYDKFAIFLQNIKLFFVLKIKNKNIYIYIRTDTKLVRFNDLTSIMTQDI